MNARQKRLKKFVRDTRDAVECRLIPTDELLGMTAVRMRRPATTMTMVETAFCQWSAAALGSKPGTGPLCFTCDTEFGPGRAVPAAFWVRSPFATQSKVTIVSGICPACFARTDCIDRIFDGMRRYAPDLQIWPVTKQ
jgi:hypothetical protein